MDLVPGRDCNECAVCCTTLLIDTPQFQKTPGSPCKHLCAGGGCSIYAERPSVCRNFHCAWRYFDILGDDWRPDRSGVLLMFVREHQLPPGYEKGLFVYVSAQSADKLNPSIYDFVARLIAAGVLIVLAVNGPPGSMPAVAYLNEQLQDAAEAHDLGRIEAAFSEALALSSAQPQSFKPITHFRDADPLDIH